jgi:hypothetical protein
VLRATLGRPRRAAALAGAVAFAGACTLLNPLGEYKAGGPLDASQSDATDGGAPEGGDARACTLTRWPARPSAGGTEDARNDIEIVNALMTFSAQPDPDAGPGTIQGYDLDGVCTCPEPESCVRPGGTRQVCDELGGVDNAGGQLLTLVALFANRAPDSNQRLRSGDYGLLVLVREYNGQANDSQVTVAFLLSNGTDGIQDGGIPPRPKYDGTDRWTVDPKSVAGGSGPPYVPLFIDKSAYVSAGVLVATADFTLRLGRMTLQLVGSTVTGTLTKDAVGYHIDDGVIVGRVAARTFLTNVSAIDDPFVDGGYMCGDSGTYRDLKTKLCEMADIVSDLKQDNTGAPCDALSVSAHFTSSTAQLGSVFGLPPPPTPCGPQWIDDCAK